MVMNENISRLMDGEVEVSELDQVCACLKTSDAMATWTCYHVIGDAMRGSGMPLRDFEVRFIQRLAAEPTVLAPRRRPVAAAATWGWAAAATIAAVTVVGWTAMSLVGETPAAMAKAGEATVVSAARARPAPVPSDYLLAHQEYSPSTAIPGVGPYLRSVAAPALEQRP